MDRSGGARQRYNEVPVSHETGAIAGLAKELHSLPTADGVFVDAAVYRPATKMPDTGLVFIHPQVNFLHHYALPSFARRGYAALGMNSRYAGNETAVLLENVVLDLEAGTAWLRANGCRHVVLVGNSGGGAVACMLQRAKRAGDALVLLNAHRGRAQVFTTWLDPSVLDERDLHATDPALDMYDARNGPPYSPAWLAAYRAAQVERNRRITRWVQGEIARLETIDGPARDFPFVVFRTAADPRFLDRSLDPSDRVPGTYWGDARAVNYMLGGLGRVSSLRSWLSQWGYDTSDGSAVEQLKAIGGPLLVLQSTADQGVFPSDAQALYDAAATDDKRLEWLRGASHFFKDQPQQLDHLVSTVCDWLAERGM